VFEDGFGFERYVDYMLDVPMYFLYRNGKYVDATGQSFRDFLKGKLPARPGEMRGADSGPLSALSALPAFWVGLLYDQHALDAAWDLVKDWTIEDHDYLRSHVPRTGL
jgi:glutamate--cysteine ligase